MSEFKSSMEKLGQDLENGLSEFGKAVDHAVDKAKQYVKSDSGKEAANNVKNAADDLGKSFQELGKSISDEFSNK